MKQNDFLKFLCRAPERMHKSFFFPLLHLQFNWNNFIQLFTEHPHIHTCTTHRHFSLSPSLTSSLSLRLFLSVSLHVSVLLLYECILTYSHTWTYSQTLCYLPLFFLCLGAIHKELSAFLSSCLSSESLSLCFLFPFFFFFFWCFLLFQSFMTPVATVPHTWSRCVVQVSDGRQIFSELQLWHLEFIQEIYKWKFSRGGNWSNLNQIKRSFCQLAGSWTTEAKLWGAGENQADETGIMGTYLRSRWEL